ncbi:MAG: peptide MFS transporter [Gemmatimonadaceae bacterium]|nr:peptide MFS transporter [Gemmatimonadaceae bacterium]
MTTAAHPRDDRAFFGHPRGLGLLFLVEMWERFSYYGMRALLVLYLVNKLGWPSGDASTLYGTYTGLVYLTPLIGGYLADRFLGTRRSLVIGGLIISIGHFTLALPDLAAFYTGLALVIVGTGFFKSNVASMAGELYAPGDPRRDAGFTIFYMGINLGGFLAPLVCAYLGERIGWHYGFGAAGVGMLLGLATYLRYRDRYLPGIGLAPSPEARAARDAELAASASGVSKPWHAMVGALAGFSISLASTGFAWLSLVMGTIIGGGLGIALLGSRGEERKRVIALFVIVFFAACFWMAFEQAGSSMNLFADQHVDRMVGSFEIPTGWFQSVNSMFILLCAPLFAIAWRVLGARGREPSTSSKMALGLFFLGIGFVFLVLAGRVADAGGKASPLLLIATYLFHTFGELCLSPVGLSYVTKVAPLRFASLLMGVWYLANAAANKVGGWLAAQTETITSSASFFSIPVATSLGSAVLLALLVPLLRRLTASVPDA